MSLLYTKSNPQLANAFWTRFHVDLPLLAGLFTLLMAGLIVLYSATTQDMAVVEKQAIRLAFALSLMLAIAQVPPRYFKISAVWLYGAGLLLLLAVLILGDIGKGAQRWLDLGVIRFQPSEIMKLAVPLMLVNYLSDKSLPPKLGDVLVLLILSLLPAFLIAKQPDLGTAILIAASGFIVIFLSGIAWRWIVTAGMGTLLLMPILWLNMHTYQRQRVLTFLNPENDPLGAGYHIIQSKIAIGSGGFYGKGWLKGTQSHLQFLPERTTDFIFSVFGEEFGLAGSIVLLMCFLFIITRGLMISMQAQDTFGRLLSGSITLIFFIYVFINIGMVSGLLPVVGIPLPLVSYGGTSMVTLMAGFGVIMSIATHRKLLAS